MATRRRYASKIRVLMPDVVPMTKEDQQQAVHAMAVMIEQWWNRHGDDDEPSKRAAEGRPAL